MTKFRIIKKQIPGYDPSYHFQKKVFIFWVTGFWTTDEQHCLQKAEEYISKTKDYLKQDVVIKEWET